MLKDMEQTVLESYRPAFPKLISEDAYYRVINLDWEKVLSFCSQLFLLTRLELIFFYSTLFDFFCVKISLVRVFFFIHNINLKKNKRFYMKLNLAIIVLKCLSLICAYFSLDWATNAATNARSVSVEEIFFKFKKTSLNWNCFCTCSSNRSVTRENMRKIILMKKG